MTEKRSCPSCWGPVYFDAEDGDTWPNGRYRLPTVPWDEAITSWDNWIVCPTCGGTGWVPVTTHIPWRDRPDSFLRGFILGATTGGWLGVVFYSVMTIITWLPAMAVLAALSLGLASLGTYMWYRG